MAGFGSSRCQEPSDSSSWTRTSSTSETIRKRVNQLLIATGAKVEPIELPPTRTENKSGDSILGIGISIAKNVHSFDSEVRFCPALK